MLKHGKLSGVVELVRPHNLVVSFLTCLIGYAAFLRDVGMGLAGKFTGALAAGIVVVLVAAGGYVINDYYDIEADRVSKPWRPLPSGRVSRRFARFFAVTLLLAGVVFAAAWYKFNPYIVGFVALNAILVHEYSRWIKRTGFLGNIVIAFNSASTIIFGSLAAAYEVYSNVIIRIYPLVPALYAFLLVLGREIVKGIEDVEGDKIAGTKTIAVTLGVKWAYILSSVILAAVVILSPLPYVSQLFNIAYLALALVVDVLIFYSIIELRCCLIYEYICCIQSARKARSILKWAFGIGALAFIAGLF